MSGIQKSIGGLPVCPTPTLCLGSHYSFYLAVFSFPFVISFTFFIYSLCVGACMGAHTYLCRCHGARVWWLKLAGVIFSDSARPRGGTGFVRLDGQCCCPPSCLTCHTVLPLQDVWCGGIRQTLLCSLLIPFWVWVCNHF